MKTSRRLSAFRPSVRLGKHGKPMRDPNGHDIDITSDLTDGSDGARGDLPYNGQSSNAQQQTPPGTQSVFGRDAQHPNNVEQTQNTQREPTLREQLSSAFKGNDGQPSTQQDAQTAQTPPPNTEAAPSLTKDSDGKYRLADGTFASAEQVQAFEAVQAGTNNQQQQQSPVLTGLTAQEAQQFQSLPAELRQYVERTMEGLNTRATRYNEYELIERDILGPRRQAFAAEGSTPAVALNQLFALSDFAGRDPGNFVLWYAQQRNLDLDALLDARDAGTANVSPEVQELRGQVQQVTGTLEQFQQQQRDAVHQANLNDVQTFSTAKDEKGALARSYLTEIMDDWGPQITAVRAANPQMSNTDVLQRAYENACWSNPTVRGKMQQASIEAQRATDAARVAAARQAGSSVTGAPSGDASTLPNNSNRSLREELVSQFAAARA